jgi:hypothetical protein
MAQEFEWDEKKDRINQRKHGVSFEEAKTVFNDPLAITIDDPDHSETEFRFIDLGVSSDGRVLVVSYTERSGRLRLISSREATAAEREMYEENTLQDFIG